MYLFMSKAYQKNKINKQSTDQSHFSSHDRLVICSYIFDTAWLILNKIYQAFAFGSALVSQVHTDKILARKIMIIWLF